MQKLRKKLIWVIINFKQHLHTAFFSD